jgi:hypothetical protein
MELHRMSAPDGLADELTAPVLIAAFDGWIDAAGAATTSANHLAA